MVIYAAIFWRNTERLFLFLCIVSWLSRQQINFGVGATVGQRQYPYNVTTGQDRVFKMASGLGMGWEKDTKYNQLPKNPPIATHTVDILIELYKKE